MNFKMQRTSCYKIKHIVKPTEKQGLRGLNSPICNNVTFTKRQKYF